MCSTYSSSAPLCLSPYIHGCFCLAVASYVSSKSSCALAACFFLLSINILLSLFIFLLSYWRTAWLLLLGSIISICVFLVLGFSWDRVSWCWLGWPWLKWSSSQLLCLARHIDKAHIHSSDAFLLNALST